MELRLTETERQEFGKNGPSPQQHGKHENKIFYYTVNILITTIRYTIHDVTDDSWFDTRSQICSVN